MNKQNLSIKLTKEQIAAINRHAHEKSLQTGEWWSTSKIVRGWIEKELSIIFPAQSSTPEA